MINKMLRAVIVLREFEALSYRTPAQSNTSITARYPRSHLPSPATPLERGRG